MNEKELKIEEPGPEDPPEPGDHEVWTLVNIWTVEGDPRVIVDVETNDDNDDGYPDPEVERWTMHFQTLDDALKQFSGGSHTGMPGHRVDVFVDGKKV